MAKGICHRESCESVIELGALKHTTCIYCNATNITENAARRYVEYVSKSAPISSGLRPPVPLADPAQAFKSDAGKVQFDLLEDGAPNALLEIAKVMSWAVEVKGYHPHSWQEIPDAIRRYKAALGRHRNAIARGERHDPESNLLHWAHAACCVIFITELELRIKL